MSGYDQAESEALAALESGDPLESGMDPNEAPDNEGQGESPESENEDSSNQEMAEDEGQVGVKASTQDDFNPQSWTLKFRDKEIQPRDRQHLVNLAQQGYLYNQRAKSLKQREQELTQQAEQYKQYQQLAEAFQQNPKFQEQIMRLYYESQGQSAPKQGEQQPDQASPDLSALHPYLSKIDTIEQRLEQEDQRRADEELQGEMEALKGKYQENWEIQDESGRTLMFEVIKHAHDNDFKTLEAAYRDMMFDTAVTRTKSETLKAQAEERQKRAKQGVVSARTGKAPTGSGQPNLRSMSYDEIAEHVINNDLK